MSKRGMWRVCVVWSFMASCTTPAAAPEAPLIEGPARWVRFEKTNDGLGRPIRVAIVTWGGYAGGLYANGGLKTAAESIFATKYNLDVEFVIIDDYPASRERFKEGGDASGGVDMMWGTVDGLALEYDSLGDAEPVAVLQYDWSRGGDAIATRGEVKRYADLKGKRIAVAEATPSHFFVLHVLGQAGLDSGDVSFVFTASSAGAAALFKQGKVDATASWSPDVYQAVESVEGAHILVSTLEANRLLADVFVARGGFAREHPELLEAFSRGWFDGVDVVNATPEVCVRLLSDVFEGVEEEDARKMIADVILTSAADNRVFFGIGESASLRTFPELLREASRLWKKVGLGGVKEGDRTYSVEHLKWLVNIEGERSTGPAALQPMASTAPVPEGDVLVARRIDVVFDAKGGLTGGEEVVRGVAVLAEVYGARSLRVTCLPDASGVKGRCGASALRSHLEATYGVASERFVSVGAEDAGGSGETTVLVEIMR